jgi:hypothetical protein
VRHQHTLNRITQKLPTTSTRRKEEWVENNKQYITLLNREKKKRVNTTILRYTVPQPPNPNARVNANWNENNTARAVPPDYLPP